jgi:hypothetical protein
MLFFKTLKRQKEKIKEDGKRGKYVLGLSGPALDPKGRFDAIGPHAHAGFAI